MISPQILLSCDELDEGCHGGDSSRAFEWINKNNITDETCSPYQSLGYSTGLECSAMVKCKNCMPEKDVGPSRGLKFTLFLSTEIYQESKI